MAKEKQNQKQKQLKSVKTNLLLVAMIELVGGIFMIIYNDRTLDFVLKIIGIIAASYGVITFFAWLIKKEKPSPAPALITLSLGLVAGVLLLVFSKEIEDVFAIIAGAATAVFGIIKFPNTMALKRSGFKNWKYLLIPIIIIVILGVLIVLICGKNVASGDNSGADKVDVNETNVAATIMMGAALILGSAADIYAMAGASRTEKGLLVEAGKEIEIDED